MPTAIPEGFHTLTPSLIVDGAAKAIELYKKAFGATEEYRMACSESGKIMHACLKIGSSKIFLCDVMPNMSLPSAAHFYVYVNDVDQAFQQATESGLEKKHALSDMFWGDRTGVVKDPFGNSWTLATHKRDISPQEMEEGRKQFMAKAKAA
jgi:uncharacterized glyoxalase superfamily protein PhnB